ncbi:hypothetical protein [Pseudoalteromonas rubra]|uniref:hypothetical protein n=1 Tax=Pseudoalteromonas rubra TaxID=43658 RepID=UPI0012E03DE7|nr:hypothetical protein [Pseudoalteromonas rubra]
MLAKENWNYTLYEMDDLSWVITVLVHRPGAETQMSFKLTDSEIQSIERDKAFLPELAKSIAFSQSLFSSRKVTPTVTMSDLENGRPDFKR